MDSRRACIAVAVAWVLTPLLAWAQPTVAIVASARSGPFQQAADALVETLREKQGQVAIVNVDLEGSEENAPSILHRVHESHPALVVTVGSLATAVVLKDAWPVPVVFSMVLYPSQSGYEPGRNVTGVALDVPLDTQFATLRQLLPSARRVGVLYHQAETGPIVSAARDAASRHGFALETKQVDEPSGVPTVLPSFFAGLDALWTVADGHVFSPQSTPALMLEALHMGVPVFGLSAPQVRMGALAAFAYDYADIGVQSAELVLRVLNGEAAQSIVPISPRKLPLALNLRTARYLNISIPPDVERLAAEVIQ